MPVFVPNMTHNWLDIQTEDGAITANIFLYDTIDEWFGIGKKTFVSGLRKSGATALTVHISSAGGNVDDALAMHDYLRGFPGRVTARLSGIVASAATIIALGADAVEMSENALFMIHNVSGISTGTARDHRRATTIIDKVEERLLAIYRRKTGKRPAELQALLNAETWLDAREALHHRFIDRIIPGSPLTNRISTDALRSTGFRNVPRHKIEALNKQLLNPHINTMDLIDIKNALKDGLHTLRDTFRSSEKNSPQSFEALVDARAAALETTFRNALQSMDEERAAALLSASESQKQLGETRALLAQRDEEAQKLRNELTRLTAPGIEQEPQGDPAEHAAPAGQGHITLFNRLAVRIKDKYGRE